jgi:hypothetical protein
LPKPGSIGDLGWLGYPSCFIGADSASFAGDSLADAGELDDDDTS